MRFGQMLRRPLAAARALAGCASLMCAIATCAPVRASGQAQPASLPDSGSSHYRLPFGSNRFLPSQAEAQFPSFLSPSDFPSAEYCGGCHQAIFRQWRESVHANSFRAPFYTKNVNLLIEEKGIEATRHCEGCHNPIALFTGALTTGSAVKRDFDADGVTCTTCHSIARLKPETGLASYVMGKPAVLIDDNGNAVPGLPSAAAILTHPAWHKRAMMRDFYRTSEFCGACHKANLPPELNGYKWLRAFSTYDEWQQSSWSRESPAPFYKKPAVSTCQTCHMQRVDEKIDDMAAAQDGTVASHRWLGANTAIPAYYGYDEQLRRVMDYLRDDKLRIDIFALEPNNDAPVEPAQPKLRGNMQPVSFVATAAPAHSRTAAGPRDKAFLSHIVAPIDQSSFRIAPGKPVTVAVVITNVGIGHSLVPEQRDFYQSWVEFLVTDQAGRTVYESGGIEPDGTVDPEAHSYTNRILSRQDECLDKHQVWSAMVRAYDNTILPGRSDLARYRFTVPAGATGLNVSVRVNYRRFRREFSNWVFGDSPSAPERYPTVVMAERSLRLNVGANVPQNSATAPAATALRWNNYGIALLDQQQFAAAAEVFEHEAALTPSQPDGQLNAGVALYMDGDYNSALHQLASAQRIDPGNLRALFYEGLCYRWQFKYDLAIDKLAPVASAFPRFRQVHDELGYIYTVRREFPAARRELEAAQAIDPDDLMAHRWLATVYGELGMKVEADREAELTSLEKEDPVAGWEVQRYWQRHPEIAREVVPYHVHSDDPADIPRQAQRVDDLQNDPSLLWFLH